MEDTLSFSDELESFDDDLNFPSGLSLSSPIDMSTYPSPLSGHSHIDANNATDDEFMDIDYNAGATLAGHTVSEHENTNDSHASNEANDIQLDAPYSPSLGSITLLPVLDDDEWNSSAPPSSPSRRSFSLLPDLPGTGKDKPSSPVVPLPEVILPEASLPRSPSSPRLRTLPFEEPVEHILIPGPLYDSEPESEPEPPTPRPVNPGLGLFMNIASADASSAPGTRSPSPETPPNLAFSPEARARVDDAELEKLISLRRRSWLAERDAKERETAWFGEVQRIAAKLCVSPPVPGALAEEDQMSSGSPPPQAGLDPMGPVRRELHIVEQRRAEARRERKREKERGKEAQALLRLKLGESPSTPVATPPARDGGDEEMPDVSPPAGAGREKVVIGSPSQLVARMVFKRRDTGRSLANRKASRPRLKSSLSCVVHPDRN